MASVVDPCGDNVSVEKSEDQSGGAVDVERTDSIHPVLYLCTVDEA
jgi:hypothetical protein